MCCRITDCKILLREDSLSVEPLNVDCVKFPFVSPQKDIAGWCTQRVCQLKEEKATHKGLHTKFSDWLFVNFVR